VINSEAIGTVLVQVFSSDVRLELYIVFFILVLLIITAGMAFYLARRETKKKPPIDHETMINAFEEPVVVLSHEDTVLSANVPFRSLFGSDSEGRPISDVLNQYSSTQTAIAERTETVVSIETGDGEQRYRIKPYPGGVQPRPPRKWVILFSEVKDESTNS
jgi:PAS domain-containing protein